MSEKRRHQRVSVALTVTMELGETALTGTATDVSLGGMYIETPDPPAYGQKVIIVCHLAESGDAFRLDATVRWGKPGGIGVQFGLLGARETHALAQYIKNNS